MGSYDEAEHERRERKNNSVEFDDEDDRSNYQGSVEYDSGDSAKKLIEKFQEIKSR